MSEISELLKFAKNSVGDVAKDFLARDPNSLKQISSLELGGKEVKLSADGILESLLLERFEPTGLTILSEESGLITSSDNSDLIWIIDPLDGSVNFLKDLGPCALSVALWRGNTPVFGVMYRLDKRYIAWGGASIGAWVDGFKIHVSNQAKIDQSILCTGFPARFQVQDAEMACHYLHQIAPFSKVRMIGSAACSLLLVASGAADAYIENEIMLWDVAAGVAIVQGAGGLCWFDVGKSEFSREVIAAAAPLEGELKLRGVI